MQVQMRYTLSSILAVIDDDSKAVRALLVADFLCHPHQVTDKFLLIFFHTAQSNKAILLLWDDESVKWRLRIDILEAITKVVLENACAWDLFAEELIEDGRSIVKTGRLSLGNFVRHFARQNGW